MKDLIQIDIEDQELAVPTPEIAQERKVAIFDLLEENSFSLPTRSEVKPPNGPYKLTLGIREGRLAFDVKTNLEDSDITFMEQQTTQSLRFPKTLPNTLESPNE